MVPRSVEYVGGLDGRVALHVPAHVQSQGKNRPAMLVGEQQSLRAFLAEDLTVALQIDGLGPRGKADLGQARGFGIEVDLQAVTSREVQRVAVNAPCPRDAAVGPHLQSRVS